MERFINMCTQKQILITAIKKKGSKCITATVSPKSFKMLRGCARKTGTKIHILTKKGLPFKAKLFFRRKMLITGILAVMIIGIWFSLHIWNIEIEGEQTVSRELIMQELKLCGLKPGVFSKSVNPGHIQSAMLARIDKLAWLWVDIKGVKATVKVKETIEAPMLANTQPCNIIAGESGIITSITVKEGHSAVKAGMSVALDQILVTGELPSKVSEKRLVAAEAEVIAKVTREYSRVYSLYGVNRIKNGKTAVKRVIEINNFEIPLYFKNHPGFLNYECEYSKKRLSLGLIPLPIVIYTAKYDETSVESVMLSYEEMEEGMREEITAVIKAESSGTIIENLTLTPTIEEDKVTVNFKAVCLTNIAKRQYIEQENYFGGTDNAN